MQSFGACYSLLPQLGNLSVVINSRERDVLSNRESILSS